MTYENWQKKGNERHFKFPFKRLYTKLTQSAQRKNIEITLTYEDFLLFTEKSVCFYCHSKLEWIKHGKSATKYNLDRKDVNLGYTKENCIECCWRCNNSKSDRYTHKEWYGMTEYFRRKK